MAAQIPNIARLSSRIVRILGCNPSMMTLQGTNTYLIGTGKRRILLDASDAHIEDYITNLKSTLENENAQIERIVITHWHHDHIGGVPDILRFAGPCSVCKMPRLEGPESENIPITFLKDGDVIKTEGATLRVHHTPGHTTDHIVLTMDEESCLFSGDCILGEGTAVFEDLYYYMRSLHTILDLDPKIIYPGHGPIIEEPTSKIQYYINHRMDRERQVIQALKENPDEAYSSIELVNKIYTATPESLFPAATMNVHHHLTKLKREGLVTESSGKWKVIDPKALL